MNTIYRAGLTILLVLVFLLLLTPAGLIARLVHDPLHRQPDPTTDSYWTHHRA